MVGWAIVLTLGLVSNLEYICLKFENVFVQMELLTFGSVPISWLRCGAYGLMEGEGGWQGYCPRNGVSLSLKPTKANIVHQNMLKHSFPFLKQPKTRQIAYSANLGNAFSLSCFQKAATLGLSQPPVSSAFFVANFKAFEEGFRFCIESLQSNLLLEHLYVGPLYRCSINNMVQIFSFSPKIPLHLRTLHCARRKSTSSMHRDLRRWPEYGDPA